MIIVSALLPLFSCSIQKKQVDVPSEIGDDIPLFPGANHILVSSENGSKFVKSILGEEYLIYPSRTDFYWTNNSADEVEINLDRLLSNAQWKVGQKWEHPFQNALILGTWMKGENELSILLLDDLDQVEIEGLSKNYRISGLQPGTTLVILHVIDKN